VAVRVPFRQSRFSESDCPGCSINWRPGEKYLKNALNWSLQSVKLESGYNNLDTTAWLYSDLGDKKNAKKYAKMAIEAAKKAGED
jgi:hypothetical protein